MGRWRMGQAAAGRVWDRSRAGRVAGWGSARSLSFPVNLFQALPRPVNSDCDGPGV